MSAVHGVVILADQRYEAPIIQAIQSRADALAIVRRCADLAEVIAAARAGVADLAVIDGADPDLTAEAVGALREAGMEVIALAQHAERLRLSALGVASVAAPASPEQVVNSLIAATRTRRSQPAMASSPPPPPPTSAGSVLAVWGTSGAPGRTTLAAGIATMLAARAPTILIDADTSNPTLSHLLGLPVHASGLSVLARAASRGALTPEDLAGACVPRYSVIDLAATSLEKASRGANRDDVALGVLARADRLVVVARGDIVGVNRLSFLARWWEEHGRDIPVDVIVNRVTSDAIGPRPVAALQAAIGAFMPGHIFHTVSEDGGVGRASLRAKALGEKGAGCLAADELEAIVAQWVPTL